jgi:hypothetical protein
MFPPFGKAGLGKHLRPGLNDMFLARVTFGHYRRFALTVFLFFRPHA